MSGGVRPFVVYCGRCDEMQHGAREAAIMVGAAVQAAGNRPVHLIVNGAPPEVVSAARRMLSNVAGRYVQVRALTADKQAQQQAIVSADLVLVPCREEHVALTGLDAIAAGTPVLIGETSALGRFLLGSGQVDPAVAEHAVVERELGEPVAPIERWTERVAEILADPEAARQRAARLREALMQALATATTTSQGAGGPAADLVKAIVAARGEANRDD